MAQRRVPFLEVDSDLLEGLDQTAAAEARSHAVAPKRTVDRGRWAPEANEFGSSSGFGLLVLGGFVTRWVALSGRGCVELLGEGAILHPWLDDGEFAVMPFEAHFTVLEPLELAVLDHGVAEVLCRWPTVVRNLMTRIMERSRHLAGHLTITQFPRVEKRLHVLLWHLAERFGRMTREGVVLRVPLTHEVLGGMVAARRPSVTTALGQLEEQGLVLPRGRHEWLLRERPEEMRDSSRPGAELAT